MVELAGVGYLLQPLGQLWKPLPENLVQLIGEVDGREIAFWGKGRCILQHIIHTTK
jgi:hypothetical protein